jgi:hypothetical protein
VNRCEVGSGLVLAMDRDLDFVTADGVMPNKSRQNALDRNDR